MLRYILHILLLIAVSGVHAQSYVTKKTAKGKAKKYYDAGMAYNMKDENAKAIKEFEKALKQEPRFIDAQLQWAAVQYVLKNFEAAEQGFEKVMDIDPLYNTKVMYTLALSEMKLKKYEQAAAHFQQYLDTQPKNKSLREKATRNQKKAVFISKALANPVPFQPTNLGENINEKERWEYFPSLTADEQTLVFTTLYLTDRQEDFYMSQKRDGIWQKAIPMKEINTPLNEGAQSISANGKFLVYTACDRKDGFGKCDLYFSEVKNGRWTKPKNMGSTINSSAAEKQPSISADGSTLYFASNRSGGEGNSDIWVSYRKKDGKWGKPQNLGPTINTTLDESFPFIHQDGHTLYLSSEGHPGMGKFDLFFSRKQMDGSWEHPTNLGYPINTVNDETSFIVSLNGQTAYFASDRDYQQVPNAPIKKRIPTDIYTFDLYPDARPMPITYVQAKVFDAISGERLMAQVEFASLQDGNSYAEAQTDEDGEFLVCLPTGKDYALYVAKEGYTFHSENFALGVKSSLQDPYLLEIPLHPIPKLMTKLDTTVSQPTVLKNVFFDTGSAELRQESYFELGKLKKLLVENEGMYIQINGHTDNIGSAEDNQQLSEHRAKAVQDYLVAQGIESGRLRFKGFGETVPIAGNDTETGRQQNRRTEFVIIANTKAPAKNP